MKKMVALLTCAFLALGSIGMLSGCDSHECKGEKWGGDVAHHWRVCDTCNGAFDIADHDYEESVDGLDVVKTCKVCNYSYIVNSAVEHEHTYSDTLSYNDAFHYKACTFEGCLQQSEKEEHVFGTPTIVQESGKITKTYQCESCQYAKVETITVDTVVKNEADWTLAFTNLQLRNYEMKVNISAGVGAYTNHCIITDNGAYVSYGSDGEILYMEKRADGGFDVYRKAWFGAAWEKYDDKAGTVYSEFATEATLEIDYTENYKDFTYDEQTGEYVCEKSIVCTSHLPDGSSLKLSCFNNVVKVADGNISHIQCEYTIPDDPSSVNNFTYYNIGIAEFKIPEEVKKTAVDKGDIANMER